MDSWQLTALHAHCISSNNININNTAPALVECCLLRIAAAAAACGGCCTLWLCALRDDATVGTEKLLRLLLPSESVQQA